MSVPGPGRPAGRGPGRTGLSQMIKNHDWSATPLGPLASWPASLCTAVNICVASRFPMVIFWGPEFRLLYNDAYLSILGTKHPRSLGQEAAETWAEIWPTIGPMLTGVLRTGTATFCEDQLLTLERAGYLEEGYFTFSYSPIPGQDDSRPGGVFCAVSDNTARVLAARRRVTLLRLGSIPVTEASSAEEACRAAITVLGGNPADVPFALAYLPGPGGEGFRLAASAGFVSPAALTEFSAGASLNDEIGLALSSQAPRTLTGLAQRAAAATVRPGLVGDAPPDTVLLLPLTAAGTGRPAGVLCCGVSPYRALDDDYRSFFDLAARQLGALVAEARSWEAERVRAQKLAELDQAKTVFFSNISHEFRTPLTLIMGPLEELRAAAPGATDGTTRENLNVMHRNALRLGKLVNTLLDSARIEAGRTEASYEPVDLAAVTAGVAASFRAAVEKAGLTFEVDCPALGEPVYVDRDMWEKVLLNLLSNAVKYTFEGFIRVSLRREPGDPGSAVLRVADSGTGVAESDLPRLFERFRRVYQARSRSQEGSGIGLALVHDLVGLHGGTIAADSVVNEGTTFTVRLPLGSAHLPAGRVAPEPSRSRPGRQRGPLRAGSAALVRRRRRRADGQLGRRRGCAPGGGSSPGPGRSGRARPGGRSPMPGAGRRRQRGHARVSPAAAQPGLPRAGGGRRRERPRRGPGRPPGPHHQRRDDAGDGRAGPGQRAAPRPGHGDHPGPAAVRPGRPGRHGRGDGRRVRRLPGQALHRGGTAGPGQVGRGAVPAPAARVTLPPRPDRIAGGRVLRLRRAGGVPRRQRRLRRDPRLRPGGPALSPAVPVGA